MRQLKFRAWDNWSKEFVYFDDLYWFEHNYVHHSGDNDLTIQQFTGIKDCNGTDIYEGDLLDFEVMTNYQEYEMQYSQKVEYDDELAMFVFGEDKWCMADHIKHDTIKVMGNTYERILHD